MAGVRCCHCLKAYPQEGIPFCCPECGGIYDYDGPPDFLVERIEAGLPGLWRYRHSFGLDPTAPVVSLGEGNTPLVWQPHGTTQVGLKLESLNPTGSYKDRGSAVLASFLLSRGVSEAVEDLSGNAGASFAAYAARSGIHGRVFVPEEASGPKRIQIEMYGAELVRVAGPRSEAARAVLEQAQNGLPYASHAYLPYGLAGIATIAYEIWEDLGRAAPGSVVAPVGHGSLLLGIVRGFAALKKAGLIAETPFYLGVQAAACDPVTRGFHSGLEAMASAGEEPTLAEGVRVRNPVRAEALIREVQAGQGDIISIPEAKIRPAFEDLARQGQYVEPTSAIAWAALDLFGERLPQPCVVVLSGFGLKYIPSSQD